MERTKEERKEVLNPKSQFSSLSVSSVANGGFQSMIIALN
jgi:hypothetical protein